MKYVVTITKEGSMETEAETEEEARAIAEEMESEGSFWIGSARKDCAPPPAVLPATGMCYSGGLRVKTLPLRLSALPMPSGVVTFPVPFKPWRPRE